jgi:hypothetical protein
MDKAMSVSKACFSQLMSQYVTWKFYEHSFCMLLGCIIILLARYAIKLERQKERPWDIDKLPSLLAAAGILFSFIVGGLLFFTNAYWLIQLRVAQAVYIFEAFTSK